MQESSLVKWVDELQAQIDALNQKVSAVSAPKSYTRETVFEGEEVTAESGALVEEALPAGTVYVFIKLYTTLDSEKQIRYSAIFDAADFSDIVRISFSDVIHSTANVEALYQFNILYGEANFFVTSETIIPEGMTADDVFMDLYAFTSDEQPTTSTKRKKKK